MANTLGITRITNPASVIMWLRTWVVVAGNDECWPVLNNIDSNGYPKMYQTTNGQSNVTMGHRLMWELFNGPIPDGMVIDHNCHNKALAKGECDGGKCKHRNCVNPAHLQMITLAENTSLGAAGLSEITGVCRKKMHEWVPENILERNGRRWCKPCYLLGRRRMQPKLNEIRKIKRAIKKVAK
jgi:HNH endonuclease